MLLAIWKGEKQRNLLGDSKKKKKPCVLMVQASIDLERFTHASLTFSSYKKSILSEKGERNKGYSTKPLIDD